MSSHRGSSPVGEHEAVVHGRSPVNHSRQDVFLPTGTVTLLAADVNGSRRPGEADGDDITSAVALPGKAVCDIVAAHHGVWPADRGGRDNFVAAFTRASAGLGMVPREVWSEEGVNYSTGRRTRLRLLER